MNRAPANKITLSSTDFADAIEALIPEMRAFARSLCKDAALADDLVQDACLKAWGARDRFRPGAAARPWLFRILRNEYYQHARRSWRNVQAEDGEMEQALVCAENAEAMCDLRLVADDIQALPDGQREAMILVVAGGFTYEEAGEICDCSAGTVKSRVSRAREAIRVAMDHREAGRGAPAAASGSDPVVALADEVHRLSERRRRVAA